MALGPEPKRGLSTRRRVDQHEITLEVRDQRLTAKGIVKEEHDES